MSATKQRQAYLREYARDRRIAARTLKLDVLELPPVAKRNHAAALFKWSREKLRVPGGHPNAGQPLALPSYGQKFLRDLLKPDTTEALFCCGRKNSKSGLVAAYVLARLVGPLRSPGYRAGVVSLNREKSTELKLQIEAIADASKLAGLKFRRSPAHVEGPDGGRVDFLTADANAGAASGFDDAIADELGLFDERDRELVNSMRSSVSARNGRFIALSVHGDSPFIPEIMARKGDPGLVIHHYAPTKSECALDDRRAWHAANPGLKSGIKSISYMEAEARRVSQTPSDEGSFRALDLNLPQKPGAEMLCPVDELCACFVEPMLLPDRSGPCYLGFDFGEATSGTAACAIWPETGRVETWLAFADNPPLKDRGRRDDAPYTQMERRGELRTYTGRIVRPDAFLADLLADLGDAEVEMAAADSYKDSEVSDFADRAQIPWPIEFRRVGAGKDGGADIRGFQRLVHGKKLQMIENLSLSTAISKSAIRRDGNGNPGLQKAHANGRIDVLSAAVIAAGLAEPHFDRAARPAWRYAGL